MAPGYIRMSEPGSMVSAGLDAKGTAHAILVDSTGRVVCSPVEPTKQHDLLVVVLIIFALALGFMLGSRPR